MKNIIRCIVDLTFTGLVDYDKRNNIELTGSIIAIILQLPWFIKIPLKLYIMFTSIFISFFFLGSSTTYTDKQIISIRKKIIKFFPFFNSFEKFIRSIGFIKLYDNKVLNN